MRTEIKKNMKTYYNSILYLKQNKYARNTVLNHYAKMKCKNT